PCTVTTRTHPPGPVVGWGPGLSRCASTPRHRGAHRQNDSVPLSANLSTSRRGTCVNEQLPSGLRAKSAWPLTVPEKLPVASANCPVPPVTCKLSCCVPLNKQLCRLIEEPGIPVTQTTPALFDACVSS